MGILNGIVNVFKIVAGQIEIVMGIVVLIGLMLQKKKPVEIVIGVIKAIVGVMILKQGSTLLQGAYRPVMEMIQKTFNIAGIVTENYSGMAAINNAIPELIGAVPIVMILGFLVNILLAKFGPLKVVFITAHTMLAFATLTVWLVNWFFGTTGAMLTLVAALFCGVFWTVMPAWTYKYSKPFLGNSFTLGHISGTAAIISSKIGRLFGHYDKKNPKFFEESESDIDETNRFSSLTRIFNDSTVVTFLLMTVVLAGGAFLAGRELIEKSAGTMNWIVYALELGGNFTVGIVVLLVGVRMMIAELVPAFKGIADRWVPGAVPSVDMPVFFPLAPFSAVLGFLGAFTGEFIGFALLLLFKSPVLLIPGIIATFFDGGIAGVFGFKYGGKKAAFISGLVIGVVQILGGLIFTRIAGLSTLGATYGNTDFGSTMALLAVVMNVFRNVWVFVVILIALYVIAALLLKKYFKDDPVESDLLTNPIE